jgi:hypothetical protein
MAFGATTVDFQVAFCFLLSSRGRRRKQRLFPLLRKLGGHGFSSLSL